jgi:hypothetical protein
MQETLGSIPVLQKRKKKVRRQYLRHTLKKWAWDWIWAAPTPPPFLPFSKSLSPLPFPSPGTVALGLTSRELQVLTFEHLAFLGLQSGQRVTDSLEAGLRPSGCGRSWLELEALSQSRGEAKVSGVRGPGMGQESEPGPTWKAAALSVAPSNGPAPPLLQARPLPGCPHPISAWSACPASARARTSSAGHSSKGPDGLAGYSQPEFMPLARDDRCEPPSSGYERDAGTATSLIRNVAFSAL